VSGLLSRLRFKTWRLQSGLIDCNRSRPNRTFGWTKIDGPGSKRRGRYFGGCCRCCCCRRPPRSLAIFAGHCLSHSVADDVCAWDIGVPINLHRTHTGPQTLQPQSLDYEKFDVTTKSVFESIEAAPWTFHTVAPPKRSRRSSFCSNRREQNLKMRCGAGRRASCALSKSTLAFFKLERYSRPGLLLGAPATGHG
jgi:hypothetical protein